MVVVVVTDELVVADAPQVTIGGPHEVVHSSSAWRLAPASVDVTLAVQAILQLLIVRGEHVDEEDEGDDVVPDPADEDFWLQGS